jgi:hypothetical protein
MEKPMLMAQIVGLQSAFFLGLQKMQKCRVEIETVYHTAPRNGIHSALEKEDYLEFTH